MIYVVPSLERPQSTAPHLLCERGISTRAELKARDIAHNFTKSPAAARVDGIAPNENLEMIKC